MPATLEVFSLICIRSTSYVPVVPIARRLNLTTQIVARNSCSNSMEITIKLTDPYFRRDEWPQFNHNSITFEMNFPSIFEI